MNIIDTLKESAIKQLISSIFGVLILLIGSLYLDIIPKIFQYLIPNVSKEAILKIGTLAILLFFLSTALSIILYCKLKNKLKPNFGVHWDKDKEPYCPTCKNLLSKYYFNKKTALKCNACKEITIKLFDDNGKELSLDEAIELL